MKKQMMFICAAVLAVMMMFVLVGCTNQDEPATSPSESAPAISSEAPAVSPSGDAAKTDDTAIDDTTESNAATE